MRNPLRTQTKMSQAVMPLVMTLFIRSSANNHPQFPLGMHSYQIGIISDVIHAMELFHTFVRPHSSFQQRIPPCKVRLGHQWVINNNIQAYRSFGWKFQSLTTFLIWPCQWFNPTSNSVSSCLCSPQNSNVLLYFYFTLQVYWPLDRLTRFPSVPT